MTTATHPSPTRQATRPTARPIDPSGNAAIRDRAAADRRLAALVDELSRRDAAAWSRRAARRPVLWLTGMTIGAVALALLVIAVVIAPPL